MRGLEVKLQRAFAALGVLACLLAPARLRAADTLDSDTREAARKLGYSGVESYHAGNYAAASDKLDKAYRVAPVPSLGLWSARALVKLGKLVEAASRYREVSALEISSGDQAVQKKALAEAATDLNALEARIPKLTVEVQGASASEVSVTIDGVPVASERLNEAQPMNPGSHRVEGRRAAEVVAVEVTLAEAEHKSAILQLGAPAPAPASATPTAPSEQTRSSLGRQRTLALVAGGVGVVGVVVGSIFGFKSKANHDDATEYCTGAVCRDQRGVNAGQDAYSAGTVSTVAMVIGAVGLAGGAALWLTAPRQEEPSAALGVGVGSLQLRGRF